jgi:hypothetical protein
MVDGLILLISSITGFVFSSERPASSICFGFPWASDRAVSAPSPPWLAPVITTIKYQPCIDQIAEPSEPATTVRRSIY